MAHRNSLKINAASPVENISLIQAINENTYNHMISKSFVFLTQTSVKRVSKASNRYYGVRLVQAKHGSYVEYHHRIPPDLAQKLPAELIKKEWVDKKTGRLLDWARFRVKGILNSVSEEDYAACASDLLLSVKLELQRGFDPFKVLIDEYKKEILQQAPVMQITKDTKPAVTFRQAVARWIETYPETSESRAPYQVIQNLLEEYFGTEFDMPVKKVTTDHLETMLVEKRAEREWEKRTYNDKVKKLRTCFKWFKKKKLIDSDVTEDVSILPKVGSVKNAYYESDMARSIVKLMTEHEMQPLGQLTVQFCMTVFYTCTRPDKETRQLKCGDVKFDQGIIMIDPKRAKGGAGGAIPLEAPLAKLFRKMGVDKAHPSDYIFGNTGVPGPEPYSESYFSWFYREQIRKPNGISDEYTLYSWKHTRIVELYLSGARIWQLQQLCRHESPTQTETYLKSLGLNLQQNINKEWTKIF